MFFRQISPKTHASQGSGSPLDDAVVADVVADVELIVPVELTVASPLVLISPVVGDVDAIVSTSPVLGEGRGSGIPQP